MKVGILGSGDVGRALGKGFVSRHHEVKIASRTPNSEKLRGDPESPVKEGRVGDVQSFPLLPQHVFLRNADTVEREERRIRCEETHLFFEFHVDGETSFFAVDNEGGESSRDSLRISEDDKVARDGPIGDEILLPAYPESAPVPGVCRLDGDGVASGLRLCQSVSEDGVATGRSGEVTLLLLLLPPILDREAPQAS